MDHVTAAGQDLNIMRAQLARIGIPSEYGGSHGNRASEMALTTFSDSSYLELIAIEAGADASAVDAHPWGKYMRGNAGPCAWAVRAPEIAAERNRLQAAGVRVGTPVRGGRARPDGMRLEWETAQVGEEPAGTFFPFLIHDLTSRTERTGKPATTEFNGITRVIIAVHDIQAGTARFRQAYGLPAPVHRVGEGLGALAVFEGTPVVLATLNERLRRFGEGPCAFVLGAARPQGRWSWFPSENLGWRLGFE